MHASATKSTARVCHRRLSLYRPTLISQTITWYSTTQPARAPADTMFKKAVQDHNPLQSNGSRGNGITPPKPQPPQSIGVKRKIEQANAGGSALGSLHSAVYFDENDFDDDDDLDFESPDPFIPPPQIVRPSIQQLPPTPNYPTLNKPPTTARMPPPPERTPEKIPSDVRYPELPPASQENVAPSSSIQYPWSSSPVSHFQPPHNPRTLPWLTKKEPAYSPPPQPPSPVEEKSWKLNPKNPLYTKQAAPWNKSPATVREEQKEMRRQLKKNQKAATSHQPRPKIASLFLSDEQRHVLDAVVKDGKSIFFTGSAGTGKSVLMREIIKKLRDKYKKEPDRIAVTASTGLAACNIEGVTLHSFAGIGLGKEQVPELVKKVRLDSSIKGGNS